MRFLLTLLALLAVAVTTVSGQTHPVNVRIEGHVTEPAKLAVSESTLGSLKAPNGFRVDRFADNLGNPRMLAAAEDGSVYVTRREQGDVVLLADANSDGKADPPVVVARRPQMHGIAVTKTQVYLVTVKEVFVADRMADGKLSEPRRIIDDLPDGGQHPNRTIAVGADGMLYISIGSTCNACHETGPEHATILRAKPDGSSRTIFASGLRNTIGFGWHPVTGEMWGMDHGIDWLGDDDQQEELNLIAHGKQYGWPYIYADNRQNPQDDPPGEITMAQWARMSQVPAALYTAHSAPMQMAFYSGAQFPAEFRGDAFVAMHGSWNRGQPSGYEVVRIRFAGGRPAIEPFLTGFLVAQGGDQWGFLGRPTGLAIMPDGSLLVSDDKNGVIYRVSHVSGQTAATTAPATASRKPAEKPAPHAGVLSRDVFKTTRAALAVSSPTIKPAGPIPLKHSDYDQKLSPALSWTGAPASAKSFVLMMEDPDAREPKPFVHWLLYNLPTSITTLPEGLPGIPRLPDVGGALQGKTSRGNVGYFGPRPPKPDPAHHYHFQVFALDTVLVLDPAADREALLAAMQGHVVAQGELVGTFKAP